MDKRTVTPDNRSAAGLTLIEILVATAMLSIVSAAIIAGLPQLVQINRASSEDIEITRSARAFMEEVRTSWQDLGRYEDETFRDGSPVAGEFGPCEVSGVDEIEDNRKEVSLACDGSTFVAAFGKPQP